MSMQADATTAFSVVKWWPCLIIKETLNGKSELDQSASFGFLENQGLYAVKVLTQVQELSSLHLLGILRVKGENQGKGHYDFPLKR